MKCKLCGSEKPKLAKSHIFPKGFFGKLQTKAEVFTYGANAERKKRPSALWDRDILCSSCEELTAPLDDYAIKIFRDKQNSFKLKSNANSNVDIIVYENVDHKKLRAFFASMLWRVSASSQRELTMLSVKEPYYSLIRQDLLSDGEFKYIDCFATFLSDRRHSVFFTPQEIAIDPIMKERDPAPVCGWQLEMPNLVFRISLDDRSHPLNHYIKASPENTGKEEDILISSSLNAVDSTPSYPFFMCYETDTIESMMARIYKSLNHF